MSFHPPQLRELIKDTLRPINWWSEESEEQLMGTAAQETLLGRYLKQLGGGPGVGIFSMEDSPPRNGKIFTHEDIWDNFLYFRPAYIERIRFTCGVADYHPSALQGDLRYQILMARIHYLRVPERLPAVNDLIGQASYWDRYFNINPDKGFPAEYKKNYKRYVKG